MSFTRVDDLLGAWRLESAVEVLTTASAATSSDPAPRAICATTPPASCQRHSGTQHGHRSRPVEMIGTGLVVQHYAYDTAGKDHCHMVSISDVLTPSGWTTVQVICDLKADPIDDKTSKYTNTVTSHPTAEFMDFIARHGQTFEEAATARQAASGDHCRRETPLFAASIGRHANASK